MLKFLVDHNVPKSVSLFLMAKKYNVKLVKEVDPEMSDLQVVKLAIQDNRIVITNDKDFISLSVKYPNVNIVLFDYFSQSPELRISGLRQVLPELKIPFGILVLQ